MKVRDVIRLLEQDGWRFHSQRGSHRQFVHPVKRGRVTVAGKISDTLHPKTLASVLKQAQIERK
jgi:predicted RNA binding protein YcfA (HicA-like mRNA interferase family)